MKRILLLAALVAGSFAGQASAVMYDLDTASALKFTYAKLASEDGGDWWSEPLTVTQDDTVYGGTIPMSGNVGFKAYIVDGYSNSPGGEYTLSDSFVTLQISSDEVHIPGLWDGYRSYVQNDDERAWWVELFYRDIPNNADHSSGFVSLGPGASANISVLGIPGEVNLYNIYEIGFRIKLDAGIQGDSDTFHVSLVSVPVPIPIPAAVLLGMLGLGVAGWKLRRFA